MQSGAAGSVSNGSALHPKRNGRKDISTWQCYFSKLTAPSQISAFASLNELGRGCIVRYIWEWCSRNQRVPMTTWCSWALVTSTSSLMDAKPLAIVELIAYEHVRPFTCRFVTETYTAQSRRQSSECPLWI